MRLTMIRNRDNERLPQNYCDFTAPGGTIGRDTNNTLILPDQSRAISRLQAVVHISPNGEAAITHRGSTTALLLNGSELPYNVQQPLADGDIIDIAGYQFSVSLINQPVSLAPLLVSHGVVSSTNDIDESVWDNLEAEFLLPPSLHHKPLTQDPHHPLLANEPENRAAKDPLAMEQETDLASLHEKICDPDQLFAQDDPFSLPPIMKDTTPSVLSVNRKWVAEDQPPSESAQQPAMDHAPSILGLSGEQEIAWPAQADGGSEDDVLLGLFADNAIPLSSTIDDGAAFDAGPAIWPAAAEDLVAVEAPAPPQAAVAVAEAESKSEVSAQQEDLSWAQQMRATEHFAFNDVAAEASEMRHREPVAYREEKADDALPSLTRLGVDPVRHQPFKPAKSASQEQLHGELFSAFVAGLGLDDAVLQPDFSPEQLYLAGKLLSLFSQGTVALLSSRSILKRGLKAEMTMILEEENNPFKMLPSGKTVLLQIFSTPMPGFIPPENAVRDAMIDLQAHQLGMIAGVRAIIAAMLQTFHPNTLEKMAAEQGTLPGKGVFAGNRKAALWDTLQAQYQRVANEVEDDFHTLFGEAFLHAYDLEIRQYKASQNQQAQ
ncbi:hypothetical protein IV04_14875 [Serratia sp. Ag1]|nr:hypothetical protein JV45_01480 [Serratia sp. Ag2]KFK98171.1 hypothetical protein IV04_14875 [Serratia sp. Ag1]